MASKSSPKGAFKVQKSSLCESGSSSEKNHVQSTSPRARADLQIPENRKQCRSPKQGCNLSPHCAGSPSGKKRLSPVTSPTNNSTVNTNSVDFDLAPSNLTSVSPGRQCLSDSKLTVKPHTRNIPVSNHRKRKIDLDDASSNESLLPSKRRRANSQEILNSCESELHHTTRNHLTVDWNQNEKNLVDSSTGRQRKSCSDTTPDSYKHSHSIGKRLSPKMTNHSLTNSWTEVNTSPKMQNSHKEVRNGNRCISKSPNSCSIKLQNGHLSSESSPTEDGKRPKYNHSISNDSVFEGTCNEPKDDDRFEKVDNEVAFNRTFGMKGTSPNESVKVKPFSGRTSPRGGVKFKNDIKKGSQSVSLDNGHVRKQKESTAESLESESVRSSCTEDSFTDDGSVAGHEGSPQNGKPKKRKNYANILPPRAPRVRREASLTAETKVHLLYERDDMDKMPPKKKSRMSQSESSTENGDLPASQRTNGSISQETPVKVEINQQVKSAKVIHKKEEVGKVCTTKTKNGKSKEASSNITSTPGQLSNKKQNHVVTETCTRCGKLIEPCSGKHQEASVSISKSNNSSSTAKSAIKKETQASHSPVPHPHLDTPTCSCHQTQRSISEPATDGSLANALAPLIGQPRRASVDAAECDKLNSLKGAFVLQLARHSTEAPTTIASQLSSLPLAQLGLLQTANIRSSNGTPRNVGLVTSVAPSNGTSHTVTEFVTSKSKGVRKVLKNPGLQPFKRRKSTNGWRGEGEPVQRPVIINNEAVQEIRYCYDAIRRKDDVIKTRDCVLLRAGTRKRDLPFVAKVAAMYEDPDTGDLMISLLWFYRPEHTEQGRLSSHQENELFACRHWDINSVACIEDKCYVVTLAEYNRFASKLKMAVEGIRPQRQYVPDPEDDYPRRKATPPQGFDREAVFFCRQVYDYRQRRVLKNPL